MSEATERKTSASLSDDESGEAQAVNDVAPSTTGAATNPVRAAAGLVRTARPRQWVKNVLVFVAPFTAGMIGNTAVMLDAVVAFVAFCLVASFVYMINDVVDVEADRAHPRKCKRPIAAGIVPVPLAYAAGAVVLACGMAISFLADWRLVLVLVVYAAVQLGYCFGLKHQPVVDLAIVSSGFLLRAIAGGVAAGIALSQWFLLVMAFGSLFMVAGKRYAEVVLVENTGANIRSSLRNYSASYLRFVWATSAAILIMSYSLWAFQLQQPGGYSVWPVISLVPFVVAVLRYAVDVDSGNAGEPEDIALRDRVLQVLGVVWVITVGLSFYL